jgi:hypothetical protein
MSKKHFISLILLKLWGDSVKKLFNLFTPIFQDSNIFEIKSELIISNFPGDLK